METLQERLSNLFDRYRVQPIGEGNPRVKQVKSIVSNTKPNPEHLFVAEGIWAGMKLQQFDTPIKAVFLCAACIHTLEAVTLCEYLLQHCTDSFSLSYKTFQKISERDKPDGILALAVLPQHQLNELQLHDKSIVLVLDGVEIPGNIGTMLRMADGAGIDGVFLCNRKARLSHPKLIKGSMGAVLSVPIIEFDAVNDCQNYLKEQAFHVYLADTRAQHAYFEEPFGTRTALVMGSERYGISKDWYQGDFTMISIPMLGACDSLNVGVAATVITYEAMVKNKLYEKRNGKKHEE